MRPMLHCRPRLAAGARTATVASRRAFYADVYEGEAHLFDRAEPSRTGARRRPLPSLVELASVAADGSGQMSSADDGYGFERQMQRRMQNLIMEILQAQPSLRDSKSYLNSFAPRKQPRPDTKQQQQQPFFQHNPHASNHDPQHSRQRPAQPSAPHPQPHPPSSAAPPPHFEFPIPPHVAHPGSLHNPSTTIANPDRSIADADADPDPVSNHPSGAGPRSLSAQLPRSIREKLHEQHRLQRGLAAAADAVTSASTSPGAAADRYSPAPSTSTADAITPRENATVAIPPTTSTSDSLADSHTALVKVQGPFTDRQLDSIAEGLVYLKKLGLVSVCVVDHDDWPEFAAEVDARGQYVAQSEELEQQRMQRWLVGPSQSVVAASSPSPSPSPPERFGPGLRPGSIGRKQERLRKRILADTLRLADALTRKGAMARPLPQAVVRVDAGAAAAAEQEARLDAPGGGVDAAASRATRPPLVSDDSLATIRSALAANQIPVLAPFAIYENDAEGTLDTLCIKADDMMVALARDMVVAARRADAERDQAYYAQGDGAGSGEAAAASSASPSSPSPPSPPSPPSSSSTTTQPPPPPPPLYGLGGEVDLMPLRLMVINREGGIPSHARGGDPHLSINLASEYHQIRSSFIWSHSHPTALRNLDAISDCLSYMPKTSSGVLVTHRSPRSLIANLITNKAAHSPSLPHRLLANKKDVRHTPTIIRPGLPIRVIESLDGVDRHRLAALLEASFRRRLDGDAYFARLAQRLDFVIVTGDYQGAAIVTREFAPDDDPATAEPIAYLDKFAVLPEMQGSGTVDFLWGALRDEVQGLGLLDALNDNGGKGGYGRGRDLVWKSRSNNPVNKWYYERSNGFVRIDTDPAARAATAEKADRGEVATPAWQLFWCDAEDKLARLSGERRLVAGPSRQLDEEAEADQDADQDAFAHYARDDVPSAGLGGGGSVEGHGLLRPGRDPLLTLLPIVAPEEGGRLERWAKCMATIPTAWAD
ncbi:related to ARG2 - acetylglutamate synthase [Pseudozyma flocculosa]|uniref:Amino-acid acetyltransferase, mitochondrial n=1 Tax=Pseudozyma flocculosa TaxID=84751 RepID=A0A5C3FC53_9BASI|nr:related to ARG2 - acetylglutamate synthase [Pseudozyma flocculosa]